MTTGSTAYPRSRSSLYLTLPLLSGEPTPLGSLDQNSTQPQNSSKYKRQRPAPRPRSLRQQLMLALWRDKLRTIVGARQTWLRLLVACVICLVCVLLTTSRSTSVNHLSTHPFAILYRIIGNDLPPRHSPAQTLQNLIFILDNEPDLPNVTKIWVINRLVDREKERDIIDLLERYNRHHILIPFDRKEYEQIPFDYPPSVPDFYYSNTYLGLTSYAKLLARDYTYHSKNIYVMNNNGARNMALKDGQSRQATWIMPWDGNCFLTTAAWNSISAGLLSTPPTKHYVYVPMMRLTDNNDVLAKDFSHKAVDEPQIIFRAGATQTFDDSMRYGRRSKVELLWRLGIIGDWDKYNFFPWEGQPARAPEFGQAKSVGWVARLFSGQIEQETFGSAKIRQRNRLLGIHRFIDVLDDQVIRRQGFNPRNLFYFHEQRLESSRRLYWSGDSKMSRFVDLLLGLQSVSEAVVDTERVILDSISSQSLGITWLRRFARDFVWSTLCWSYSNDEKYAQLASHSLRTWVINFLNSNSLVNKITARAPMLTGSSAAVLLLLGEPISLFDFIVSTCDAFDEDLDIMKDWMAFPQFFDSVRLLQRGGHIKDSEAASVAAWSTRLFETLSGETFEPSFDRPLHVRSFFDQQLAALAAFSDLAVPFYQITDRTQSRLVGTISLISELADTLDRDCYGRVDSRGSFFTNLEAAEMFSELARYGQLEINQTRIPNAVVSQLELAKALHQCVLHVDAPAQSRMRLLAASHSIKSSLLTYDDSDNYRTNTQLDVTVFLETWESSDDTLEQDSMFLVALLTR